ncbi:MAG: hypothetical protein ACTSPB_01330 [Candidatus Thorarchaeota archaeon]
MNHGILLGFEVGTAKKVYMPEGHATVTGMTQLSGKTTTLEALVERGNITAIAFLTKRGESGFKGQRFIQPYYQEQTGNTGIIDWVYVESILEATMGEKMRLERSFIINACNGRGNMKPAKSLQDVYENFKIGRKEAKRGFDESIFTNLSAYFEIVLPEIKKHSFADKLDLTKGFNVMNLIDMPEQMQQLVIRATMEYVYSKCSKTVVIIPEAHKFIPPSKTPVKPIALKLIREGASLGNYVWIDTQETTSVDKQLLKQVSIWIMGYQQEKNEVKNIREHLGRKVKIDEITNLKLGHFLALLRKKIYHVYVLPAGVSEQVGKNVALGKVEPQVIKEWLQKARSGEDEEMYKQRCKELEEEIRVLNKKLEEAEKAEDSSVLQEQVNELETRLKEAEGNAKHFEAEFEAEKNRADGLTLQYEQMEKRLNKMNAFVTSFQDFIMDTVTPYLPDEDFQPPIASPLPVNEVERPESVDLTVDQPILNVNVVRKVEKLEIDVTRTQGQIYYLYATGELDGLEKINTSIMIGLLEDHGWNRSPQIKNYLDDMEKYGFLEAIGKEARMINYRVRIPSDEAKKRGLIRYTEKVVN